jgi:hypothetical protein
MNNTESGWTTVGAGGGGGERSGNPLGGWRTRTAAAAGGAGSGSGWQPSGPRTFGLGRTASSAGGDEAPMTRSGMDGWGRASGGGERSGYPSGGRPMPAAFGGGEREKRNERLEEQRMRAAAEAERKRKEEREAAEAAKRLAKKMDFADEEEYPALGGAGAAKARAASKVNPKATMDFRSAGERGAALAAAQEAEEETRLREYQRATFMERMEAEERAAHRRRLAQITTRCYDDGFDEYEPPYEEDEAEAYAGGGGAVADMGEMPEFEDDEEGEESLREAGAGHRAAGEFNAHLAVSRRRGDKSDW